MTDRRTFFKQSIAGAALLGASPLMAMTKDMKDPFPGIAESIGYFKAICDYS
jgi:hypothetical protein